VLYAAAMALALVYLGEHYAVDLVAGVAVAAVAWPAAERLLAKSDSAEPGPG
jgi:membrane-associated phospholipid phosphatase